jgi:hypothetical protein
MDGIQHLPILGYIAGSQGSGSSYRPCSTTNFSQLIIDEDIDIGIKRVDNGKC